MFTEINMQVIKSSERRR